MDEKATTIQSKAAYMQWAVQWREHAKIHSEYSMKSLRQFENSGIGKAILCVGNGYSFEENIETIKANRDNVDIMACDKTLGHLLDNGIKPDFCMVCDANVNYDKYLAKYKDQLQDTILFINVCGNPEWTKNGNWKDVFFFVNKDVIDSHKEFSSISGCNNFIPAATNVSNAMVVLLTQSDNEGRRNFFGYDKILLIGFDYSWKHKGKYYAFDKDAGGKSDYMRHSYIVTPSGEFAYTSGNLTFSAQWITKYVETFNLPIVQCAKDSICLHNKYSSLEKQITYSHKRYDKDKVLDMVKELRSINKKKSELEKNILSIGRDHWLSHLAHL